MLGTHTGFCACAAFIPSSRLSDQFFAVSMAHRLASIEANTSVLGSARIHPVIGLVDLYVICFGIYGRTSNPFLFGSMVLVSSLYVCNAFKPAYACLLDCVVCQLSCGQLCVA